MPDVRNDVAMVMNLYRRCKTWKCLPSPGGLMDQDEALMSLLDLVDAEVEKIKAKRIEDQRSEVEKQRMLRNLNG